MSKEESFRDTTQRGVKQGMLKNTVDKGLEPITNPVTKMAQEIVKKLHPDAGIADPMVKQFIQFLALTGSAEIAQHSPAVLSKIPGLKGITTAKAEAFAGWMRGYAGEQSGTKTADATFKLAPVLTGLLSNPDMMNILNEIAPDADTEEDTPVVEKLSEED